MIRYKLTDSTARTHNNHQWSPGEWFTATGAGDEPCTNGVIHYYDSPHAAVLFNLIHAGFPDPVLWEFETDNELGHDGLKGWCKRARTVRVIPLPAVTTEQRIEFAIRIAVTICREPAWLKWAENWLSGKNRTARAADAAAYAARTAEYAAYAAYAAVDAAYAARAAADAARAADAAAYAARTAAYAARTADAAHAAAYAAYAAADAAVAAAVDARQLINRVISEVFPND